MEFCEEWEARLEIRNYEEFVKIGRSGRELDLRKIKSSGERKVR